jgi:hypothetical protein
VKLFALTATHTTTSSRLLHVPDCAPVAATAGKDSRVRGAAARDRQGLGPAGDRRHPVRHGASPERRLHGGLAGRPARALAHRDRVVEPQPVVDDPSTRPISSGMTSANSTTDARRSRGSRRGRERQTCKPA